MKTELNTECHISNLNDLQENKKENPIEKKKCTEKTLCAPTKQECEKKHLLRTPVAP